MNNTHLVKLGIWEYLSIIMAQMLLLVPGTKIPESAIH